MKTLSKIFGVALLAVSLAACGSNTTPLANNYGYGANGMNGYQTNYGNTGTGGCVPLQSGSIPFTAKGAQVGGALILAGNFPMNSIHPGQQFGQVMVGQGGMTNTGPGMIQFAPFQTQYGQLQLTASTSGTVSGVLSLSQNIVAQVMGIAAQYGGVPSYNPSTPQQNYQTVCVSSLTLDVVEQSMMSNTYYNGGYNQPSMGQIYQAQVYLYLNNGLAVGPITLR